MNDSLHISDAGLTLEKHYEKGPPDISPNGFATRKYLCDAGKPTIGWGHRIRSAGDYMMTACIDDVTAEKLLRFDNIDAEHAIKRHVSVELAQHEFDALCCLILNIGEANFAHSTLLRKLNTDDRQGAADEFLRWDKYHDPHTGLLRIAAGLHDRRLHERALFLGESLVFNL